MSFFRPAAILLVLAAALTAACGDDDGSDTDSGTADRDGGATIDGGQGLDAGEADGGGSGADGGNVLDGSVDGDASAGQDGGALQDAGAGSDGGEPPLDSCSAPGASCVACVIEKPPETEADCVCLGCPAFPGTARTCRARQAQYTRVCSEWARANPCPVPLCTAPPPVACVDDTCVIATRR